MVSGEWRVVMGRKCDDRCANAQTPAELPRPLNRVMNNTWSCYSVRSPIQKINTKRNIRGKPTSALQNLKPLKILTRARDADDAMKRQQ